MGRGGGGGGNGRSWRTSRNEAQKKEGIGGRRVCGKGEKSQPKSTGVRARSNGGRGRSNGGDIDSGGGDNCNSSLSRSSQLTTKVPVEGVRRVWGTMKVTTTNSLKSAISIFCPVTLLKCKKKTIN